MKKIRKIGNLVVIDKRKTFQFTLSDGRIAETKSDSFEKAKKYIEKCLQIKLAA